MGALPIKFGRLVKNIGDAVLPPHLCADAENVDIPTPGEVERRKGYQRTLAVDFGGKLTLVKKFEDTDGGDIYLVISPDGIEREDS